MIEPMTTEQHTALADHVEATRTHLTLVIPDDDAATALHDLHAVQDVLTGRGHNVAVELHLASPTSAASLQLA
jgi:hypothetical protein